MVHRVGPFLPTIPSMPKGLEMLAMCLICRNSLGCTHSRGCQELLPWDCCRAESCRSLYGAGLCKCCISPGDGDKQQMDSMRTMQVLVEAGTHRDGSTGHHRTQLNAGSAGL